MLKAVFAFSEEEARTLETTFERWHETLHISGANVSGEPGTCASAGIDVVWGSSGLQGILQRSDISVCIVDVHLKLLPGLLPKLWVAGMKCENDCHPEQP